MRKVAAAADCEMDRIHGVGRRPLAMHADSRGAFTEAFRNSWGTGIEPVQWNLVRSHPGVLRGVHVHLRHDDYLIVVSGSATIGLRDLRRDSPTEGRTAMIELRGDALTALTIPPGVAHGFYFREPSIHLYAVSDYWNAADELGCHWADPDLQLRWPTVSPTLSPRDASAPSLQDLLIELASWQPIGADVAAAGVCAVDA